MFSGIVEARVQLLEFVADDQPNSSTARIKVKKPCEFNDLNIGDSIAVNGVCLTVEAFTDDYIQFALGAETLQATGWRPQNLGLQPMNLERSLRLGDRVHGHMVSGHVDGMAIIADLCRSKEHLSLKVRVPEFLLPFIWRKGSVALNGVSLTIHQVCGDQIEVGLIPETLRRTNLEFLNVGDRVTIEVDQLARGLARLGTKNGGSSELHT